MLYNWSGAVYRSKQIDVAAVVVVGFWTIRITHREDGAMIYEYGMENKKELYETEGFDSKEKLDEWFRPIVKRGKTKAFALMRFRLANA